MDTSKSDNGYLSLCYHYIKKKDTLFPDILGFTIDDFKKQVLGLRKDFDIISPKEALDYSYTTKIIRKPSLLLTFDDGLSDHYEAALYLNKLNIKAFFFIPTCILNKEPANPIIIHYVLAKYRIAGLLDAIHKSLIKYNLNLTFKQGISNQWDKINDIKKTLNSKLNYKDLRKVLLSVYNLTMARDYKDACSLMHLTEQQMRNMIKMGHVLGAHSHTHVSLGSALLSKQDINNEIIKPREILRKKFNQEIYSMSYPFGLKQDCIMPDELSNITCVYKLAYSIDGILNTKKTSPLLLGRHMLKSKDKITDIISELKNIQEA